MRDFERFRETFCPSLVSARTQGSRGAPVAQDLARGSLRRSQAKHSSRSVVRSHIERRRELDAKVIIILSSKLAPSFQTRSLLDLGVCGSGRCVGWVCPRGPARRNCASPRPCVSAAAIYKSSGGTLSRARCFLIKSALAAMPMARLTV